MKKGSTMTSEQRKKISETKKKLYSEGKITHPMKGKSFIPNENQLRALRESRKLSYTKEATAKKVQARIMKGNYKQTEEVRRKISLSLKGLHLSPKTEFKKGLVPWMKGKHQSEKSKRKLSESLKGLHLSPKTEFKKGFASLRKGKKHSEESKIKIGLAGKGRPSWNKGINFPAESERAEWQIKLEKGSRERLLKQYESGTFPQQENTKPERQIKEELLKRGYKEGIDFIHQYKFMNKFMCDFCFPKQKVVVEVDGDFWHANPKRYPEGSILHKHQIKGIGRDKSKDAYITKVDNGSWTMLRFWESDIKKDVAKCVDKIEETLKQKRQI